MKTKLSAPKKIITQEEQSITTDELTINRIVNLPGQKVVRVFIAELPTPITLWEGEAYDVEGKYTHADVTQRLQEILDRNE